MFQKLYLLIFLIGSISLNAQNTGFLNGKDYKIISNESYGEFERNKFDIILPSTKETHGLVIYVHGGGFSKGDKSNIYQQKKIILDLLENNIAIATINYRYIKNNDSLGVKVCLNDVKQALQYLRFNALKFNIDKKRVGMFGSSAGAGSSLYLAFHDDLAIKGDTTLLGESTRIQCAGALNTQATYNVFAWKKFIPWFGMITILKRKELFNYAAKFYGYPNYESFKKDKKGIVKSLDMLSMIDAQDPPIYLMNLLKENFPKNNNIIQHHKKHAVAVSRKLNKYKVENYLFTPKNVKQESDIDLQLSTFFVKQLNE